MNEACDLVELRDRTSLLCDSLGPLLNDRARDERGTISEILVRMSGSGLTDLTYLKGCSATVGIEDMQKACAVAETLAAHSGTLASIYMVNVVLGGACIALSGNEGQRARLLPRILHGDLQTAFALTEPAAGSDAASIQTRASGGPDEFVVNGEKIYTTGAATADVIIVVTRTDSREGEKRPFTMFLLSPDMPGLEIESLPKLAANLHASCCIKFQDVRVRSDMVLGGPGARGAAWTVLRETGNLERILVAWISVGLASAVAQRAMEFAKERTQFGQPIATFQVIEHALVEMRTLEEAMRLLAQKALQSIGTEDEAQHASMAKYFCAEQLQRVVQIGMRLLGGRAFFDFEPMSRYYREAPFVLYAGGTIEVQKMIIARSLGLK